ncbi:sporulation protein [Streptomyces sp. NPDC001037]|uniref:sporulation protein n=1 Tax=Streptomyces sp. NPDC001037 TaxID=3364542 RepID=UPI0036A402EB
MDVDAQVLAGVIRPGDTVPGQVVVRGGLLGTAEVAGRALGVVLEPRTRVDDSALRTGSDEDLLHVSPLPLHEALPDAFAGHGYTCETGRLVEEWTPGVDEPYDFHQLLELRDRATDGVGTDLELVLLTNAVGCEVLLRRSGHGVRSWEEKPPAGRFVVAHHDLDRTDRNRLVGDWLREVRAV